MKKVIGSLLLSLFVVVFLPSCGGGDSGSTGGGGTTTPPANTGTTDTGTNNSDSGTKKVELPDEYELAKDGTILYKGGKVVDLTNPPENLKAYVAARNEQDGVKKGSSADTNVPTK